MSFITDIKAARDSLSAELKGETARRAAIVAAGNPPPTTYTVGGKNYSWNEYLTMMLAQIKDFNQTVIDAGGDGGLLDEIVQGYC